MSAHPVSDAANPTRPGPLTDARPRGVKGPVPVPPRQDYESPHVQLIGTEVDPLQAFSSQHDTKPAVVTPEEVDTPASPSGRFGFWMGIAAAVVVTAVVTFGVTSMPFARSLVDRLPWTGGAAPELARLTVTTRPEGVQVSIDGAARGVTPLTLSLSPGAHTIRIRHGSVEREIPITAAAGADIVRDFEVSSAPPAGDTGVLAVVTEPPGAQVSIDGRPAGTSPITVDAVATGGHTIAVAGATGSAERTVTVTAGQTSSVVFSLPKVAAGPVGGWLSVSVPFDVQVLERDEVIGMSGGAKIMLAAGRHDLLLVNRALDYQETRRVDVAPGQTSVLRIDPPKVSININARPWADVSIDGRELGQTPIANAVVTLGTHELVFRHPQLGERRQTVTVTSKAPQRVAVDLTK